MYMYISLYICHTLGPYTLLGTQQGPILLPPSVNYSGARDLPTSRHLFWRRLLAGVFRLVPEAGAQKLAIERAMKPNLAGLLSADEI